MRRIAAAVAVMLLGCGTAEAQTVEAPDAAELTELSLEDLLEAEVTSVAKRPQRVEDAAAAVFVITQEDIRRSGATSLPELFRMAPGMEVAGLASENAAVSSRGFNGRFSNKLLVLVDGRAIYLSTLSGVLWDQQLPPVEDIQRIEIVRGPGATLWGANAVNGVINIVTKHAVDTLGVALGARIDGEGSGRAFAQIGTRLGETGALRAYVVARETDGLALASGDLRYDLSSAAQAGVRLDVEPSAADAFTLQAEVYTGEADISRPVNPVAVAVGQAGITEFSGYSVLGRWTRSQADGSSFSLQAYWDHVERTEGGIDGWRDQLDFDFSHQFRLGDRHHIVWGAGYRWSEDEVRTGADFDFVPESRSDSWYGAYVEDSITLVPDRLRVSVGAKFEHNDYTGFEVQPSIRGIWTDPGGWALWAAVSRAVRTPSRLETALAAPDPFVAIAPAPDLDAEELLAWEIGWRGKLSDRVSLDLTAYRQDYDNLVVWSATPATGPGQPFLTLRYVNAGQAVTTGVEAALDARVTDRWTIRAAASATEMNVEEGGFTAPGLMPFDEGNVPRWQVSVRSLLDVTDAVDLDVWLRRTDELETGGVEAYTDLDVRLAWRPAPTIELFIHGENLLDERRVEIIETGLGSPSAVVERRVWLGAAWRY